MPNEPRPPKPSVPPRVKAPKPPPPSPRSVALAKLRDVCTSSSTSCTPANAHLQFRGFTRAFNEYLGTLEK